MNTKKRLHSMPSLTTLREMISSFPDLYLEGFKVKLYIKADL